MGPCDVACQHLGALAGYRTWRSTNDLIVWSGDDVIMLPSLLSHLNVEEPVGLQRGKQARGVLPMVQTPEAFVAEFGS